VSNINVGSPWDINFSIENLKALNQQNMLLNNLIIEATDRLENVENGFGPKFNANSLIGISKHLMQVWECIGFKI
jgi:hypothetical protein